jgi:hypothetical protein
VNNTFLVSVREYFQEVFVVFALAEYSEFAANLLLVIELQDPRE